MNSTTDPTELIGQKTREWAFPFSEKEWADTCESVKKFLLALM